MRRETFHTPGELTLNVRVPSGEIALESVDGEETVVELDVSGFGDDSRGARPGGAGSSCASGATATRCWSTFRGAGAGWA